MRIFPVEGIELLSQDRVQLHEELIQELPTGEPLQLADVRREDHRIRERPSVYVVVDLAVNQLTRQRRVGAIEVHVPLPANWFEQAGDRIEVELYVGRDKLMRTGDEIGDCVVLGQLLDVKELAGGQLIGDEPVPE